MLTKEMQQSMTARLNRVEGQLRGIRRMVQEPRLCIEILQQLAAAEAALNRVSLEIFRRVGQRDRNENSRKAQNAQKLDADLDRFRFVHPENR